MVVPPTLEVIDFAGGGWYGEGSELSSSAHVLYIPKVEPTLANWTPELTEHWRTPQRTDLPLWVNLVRTLALARFLAGVELIHLQPPLAVLGHNREGRQDAAYVEGHRETARHTPAPRRFSPPLPCHRGFPCATPESTQAVPPKHVRNRRMRPTGRSDSPRRGPTTHYAARLDGVPSASSSAQLLRRDSKVARGDPVGTE
jgi:hypothetical protein